MVVVNYLATNIRDYVTTFTDYLAIGTSTSQAITLATSTLEGEITTIAKQSISYPSSKKATIEYVLSPNEANGNTLRRIAIKETSSTTQVITISDIPEFAKNNLIGVSFEVTLEVINQ